MARAKKIRNGNLCYSQIYKGCVWLKRIVIDPIDAF